MFTKNNIKKGTVEFFNKNKKFGIVITEKEKFFFNSEEEFKQNDPVWIWTIGSPVKEGKLPKAQILYRLNTDIIFNINPNFYGESPSNIFYQEFPEGEYIKINNENYKNSHTGEIFRFIPEYKSKNNTPSLGERFLHGEKYLKAEQEKIAEQKRQKEIQKAEKRKREEEMFEKTKIINDNLISYIKNEMNKLPQTEEIIYSIEEIDENIKKFTSNKNPKIDGDKAVGNCYFWIRDIEDEILNIEETNHFIEKKKLEFISLNSNIEEEILNRIECPPIEDIDCSIKTIILNGEVHPIQQL